MNSIKIQRFKEIYWFYFCSQYGNIDKSQQNIFMLESIYNYMF